jgi:D-glycerate 3-kinase
MESQDPKNALAPEAAKALALWPALPGLATASARQGVLALAQAAARESVLAWPAAVPAPRRRALEAHGAALAAHLAAAQGARGAPLLVLLNGAQGSGKSTFAALLAHFLPALGLRCACLSLDDFYLGKAERARRAETVHSLFQTRGVPGTHDIDALRAAVEALLQPGAPLALPQFDKALDDRAAAPRLQPRPVDCLILEGWCVGAPPPDKEEPTAPLNALEAEADPDGRWRAAVDEALAGPYEALFQRFSGLIHLQVPSFESVYAFREAQEAALRARSDQAMTPEAVRRFIAHYERLTRRQLRRLPARADLVLRLAPDHALVAVEGAGIQG